MNKHCDIVYAEPKEEDERPLGACVEQPPIGGPPIIHKNINENADSLEIGSASKGGKVKVYGTYDDVSAFKKKLDNAKAVRDYANANICVNV